jgi:hypothetical protein
MIKNYFSTNAYVNGTRLQISSWVELKGCITLEDQKTINSLLEGTKPNKIEKCDKVWFSKGSITRDKMRLVTDEMKIKRVRKIEEADKFIIDNGLFQTDFSNKPVYCLIAPISLIESNISSSSKSPFDQEYVKKAQKIYPCKEVIISSSNSFEKVKKELNDIAAIDPGFSNCKIETFYEVEGMYRVWGWGENRGIKTNERLFDFFNNIKALTKDSSKGILLTEFFREADADNASLDLDTYENLIAMVSSGDKDNALMGLEVLSNCLVPEGNEPLISLVFKHYYQKHGLNKSKYTVSINSFIKRYKHVHDISNDNYKYLIPKLMNMNSSNEIKNIIDKMMIDEINRNYFNNSDIKVTSLQLNN